MPRRLTFRQMLLSILALWYDLSRKEIGAGAGIAQKRVSQILRRDNVSDENFDKVLAGLKAQPAAVSIVTECLESLEGLEKDGGLTAEERTAIERGVLVVSRLVRETLTEAAHRSRAVPAPGYPAPADIAPARRRAEELWARLKDLDASTRSVVVRLGAEYQSWALCERACESSVREVSRNLEKAAEWAGLAQEIAQRVPGPDGWRNSNRSYAGGHAANVLKVAGELKPARAAMEEAKRLRKKGSDPAGVLDPGRLLDLEASLCIEERRLDQALALLDAAAAVGHHPERSLILKGIRLEKMGEYERAIETLLRALPRVQRLSDRRQWAILNFNLAVSYCHVGLYHLAADLEEEVLPLVAEMGDEIALNRFTWLRGRIAAGLGRNQEGRSLLAQARREFARWKMSYDVAQALLEEAALLLDENRTAEVKVLAKELTRVFESKGVHREALAALRLFHEAAERETATAELARRVLRYLFRARDDQDLWFIDS